MNLTPNRLKAAIALNALVIVLEAFALHSGFTRNHLGTFVYYTTLSNLFGAIACGLCLVFEVRELRKGCATPRLARLAKYAASCCVLLTLLVVIFVLAPALCIAGKDGYYLMFCEFERPITHLVNPVLVFVSYVLFEADRTLTFKQSFIGFAPTLLYAIVAYSCNIARIWDGPYPFFQVWNMPIWLSVLWFAALCALALGLCQAPRLACRRFGKANRPD